MNREDAILTMLDAYRRIEQINQQNWFARMMDDDERQKLRRKVMRCWIIVENFIELDHLATSHDSE